MSVHQLAASAITALAAAALLAAAPPRPARPATGTLAYDTVPGPSLAGNALGDASARAVTVYLPPGYAADPARRYPTVYLLHGYGGDERGWTAGPGRGVAGALDSLAAADPRGAMIVVMPNAHTRLGGSMYANSAVGGRWEDYVARDLVRWTDAHYRTVPSRGARGVAGHSMGGYGALRLGMRRPDVFGAVYATSPCCISWGDLGGQNPAWDTTLALRDTAALARAGFYPHVYAALAAAWSPDLGRRPLPVAYPFRGRAPNGDAVRDSAAYARWTAAMLVPEVPRYRRALGALRGLAFDVGTREQFASIAGGTRALDSALTRAGVAHTFEVFEGDHVDRVQQRLATRAFPFFARLLGGAGAPRSGSVPAAVPNAAPRAVAVVADFARGADYPLVKSKFNLYNTAIPTTAAFERDATLLYELNVESVRIEQLWGFGQTLSRTVGGAPHAPSYDWALPDHWQRLVTSSDKLFHWGYDYAPYPLAARGAEQPPLGPWGRVVRATARHLADLGAPTVYHEVWNEPDNPPVFFTGAQADYHALYKTTVGAIRAEDPDAKVGGPTVATPAWYGAFRDYVRANALPLDFFSFHSYGLPHATDFATRVARVLAADPYFDRTEMVLDEFHHGDCCNWFKGGYQDRYTGATDLLHDFLVFLARPEVTSLNWAQYQDPCDCGFDRGQHNQYLGLVTLDGHRKAAFNAFKIYGMMPPDRKAVTVSPDTVVEAAASGDGHRAGVLVLNRTGGARRVTVRLRGVPFAFGTVRVYRIDSTHSSYGDGANEALAPSETFERVRTDGWSWAGEVPEHGTLFVEAEDGSGAADAPARAAAEVVRVNRYYPARGTSSYSDFDRRTWVARQGAGDDARADQQVGVTAVALPAVLAFRGQIDSGGAGGCLLVRVDYAAAGARGPDGAYARGAAFHGPVGGGADRCPDAGRVAVAFGTRRAADTTVRVADLGDFSAELARYAPPGWGGRADVTFVLRDAAPHTRVRWAVRGVRRAAVPTAGAGDARFDGGVPAAVATVVNANAVSDPVPDSLYRRARVGDQFAYAAAGLRPGRSYLVRLHFADPDAARPGRRLFDVWANDRQLLDRFDVAAAAGGPGRAVVRELFVPADERGRVRLRFVGVAGAATVSAVEVLE